MPELIQLLPFCWYAVSPSSDQPCCAVTGLALLSQRWSSFSHNSQPWPWRLGRHSPQTTLKESPRPSVTASPSLGSPVS